MGQHMTGALGRALKGNGYATRRQLNADELQSYLRPLYDSLFHEIGYVAAVTLDTKAVATLHDLMKQRADETGLDYVVNPVSARGFTLGLSLACVRLFLSSSGSSPPMTVSRNRPNVGLTGRPVSFVVVLLWPSF